MQDEINKAIDELASEIIESSIRSSEDIVDDLYDIRLKINDLLDKYAKKDGTISPSRLRTLMEELNDIEGEIGVEFYDAMDKAIEDVSEKTANNLTSVLIAVLGVAVVFGGKDKAPKDGEIAGILIDFIFNRESYGTNLAEKISSVAGYLRNEFQQAIQYGIQLRENVTQISRRVREAFKRSAWRFKRIITTEIPLAFRKGLLTLGGWLGVIKAVKIIDNRGRHRYHESHECYRLAEQDPYRMGKGVYLPKDTYILDPHPQCSAYYHYILSDEILEGGGN